MIKQCARWVIVLALAAPCFGQASLKNQALTCAAELMKRVQVLQASERRLEGVEMSGGKPQTAAIEKLRADFTADPSNKKLLNQADSLANQLRATLGKPAARSHSHRPDWQELVREAIQLNDLAKELP